MTGTQREAATSIAWDPVDSRGPARPVEGAERGGTLRILRDGDYDHPTPNASTPCSPRRSGSCCTGR